MPRLYHLLALAALSFPLWGAHAQPTITFEPDAAGHLPDGSLAEDDMEVRDQFLSLGVRFGYDDDLNGEIDEDGAPLFEAIGGGSTGGGLGPLDGFNSNATGMRDTAAPGHEAQLGEFFLRNAIEDRGRPLLIEYAAPVDQASGEIWDIDAWRGRTEQWRVEALSQGSVIASELSPEGTDMTLDSRPWSFTIRAPRGAQIDALRLVFVGTKEGSGIGIAFNNFSPGGLLPSADLDLTVLPAVELRWNSEPGVEYQVQWITRRLRTRGWQNLGAPVMGTGGVLAVFDSKPPEPREYRVIEN